MTHTRSLNKQESITQHNSNIVPVFSRKKFQRRMSRIPDFKTLNVMIFKFGVYCQFTCCFNFLLFKICLLFVTWIIIITFNSISTRQPNLIIGDQIWNRIWDTFDFGFWLRIWFELEIWFWLECHSVTVLILTLDLILND